MSEFITKIFYPILSPIFDPINSGLTAIPMVLARFCAIGLFLGAIIWVWTLNKKYVNLDRPNQHWYTDLRVWTILSMLPHFVLYLFL